jgi:hypothetical protein
MTASDIIDKFGSAAALGRTLGIPATTVASWRQNNYIPTWRQPALLALAHSEGVALSTADFPVKQDAAA